MISFVAFLIALTITILWQQRHIIKLSWQIPGPTIIPLVGTKMVWMNLRDILPYFDKLSSTYGSPFRYFMGMSPIVFVSDAENAKIVLSSKDCLNKPDIIYKIFRDTLSVDGLITLEAEKWKLHRRLIRPTLSMSSMSEHIDIFNRCIRDSVAALSTSDFVDIFPSMNMCMLTMFLEASLGSDLNQKSKEQYLHHFNEGVRIATERMFQPILHIDFIWKFMKSAKILSKYQEFGRELFTKVLKEKCESANDGSTFIERLFTVSQRNEQFSPKDVGAETVTILGGASDTLALTASFAAVMLALHPKYQEKVFQEVLEIMPDPKMDLSQADLDKLPFTDLCLRETLRLFPSIPCIARYSTKPITMANGTIVPANVPIVIGLRQIQTQEEYYGPTAKQFNPNRFNDEVTKNLPSAANIPFSYGPRNCIGYFYAQVAAKMSIAHLIRNYRLSTTYKNIDELKLLLNIGLRLVDKHVVKMERRA